MTKNILYLKMSPLCTQNAVNVRSNPPPPPPTFPVNVLFSYLVYSTYRYLSTVYPQQSSKEVLSSVNGTGIAMLFSAGTFLYVATVHVLPELMSMTSQCDTGSEQGRSDGKMQRTDLFLMVFGIVSPLLLSQTHSHGH